MERDGQVHTPSGTFAEARYFDPHETALESCFTQNVHTIEHDPRISPQVVPQSEFDAPEAAVIHEKQVQIYDAPETDWSAPQRAHGPRPRWYKRRKILIIVFIVVLIISAAVVGSVVGPSRARATSSGPALGSSGPISSQSQLSTATRIPSPTPVAASAPALVVRDSYGGDVVTYILVLSQSFEDNRLFLVRRFARNRAADEPIVPVYYLDLQYPAAPRTPLSMVTQTGAAGMTVVDILYHFRSSSNRLDIAHAQYLCEKHEHCYLRVNTIITSFLDGGFTREHLDPAKLFSISFSSTKDCLSCFSVVYGSASGLSHGFFNYTGERDGVQLVSEDWVSNRDFISGRQSDCRLAASLYTLSGIRHLVFLDRLGGALTNFDWTLRNDTKLRVKPLTSSSLAATYCQETRQTYIFEAPTEGGFIRSLQFRDFEDASVTETNHTSWKPVDRGNWTLSVECLGGDFPYLVYWSGGKLVYATQINGSWSPSQEVAM